MGYKIQSLTQGQLRFLTSKRHQTCKPPPPQAKKRNQNKKSQIHKQVPLFNAKTSMSNAPLNLWLLLVIVVVKENLQIPAGIRRAVGHAHMAHKSTKWHILKVPTGPAMRPSCETACKIYTILWKRFSVVKFCSVMTNKHIGSHNAFAL